MTKPIISFDLDQTLLDHTTFSIPDSAMYALEKLREDFTIVLGTGRDMDNHYSRQFKDIVKPDAIIHLNGTKITVGDQLFFEHFMDKELLKNVLTYGEKMGYCIGVTIGDEDYYINPERVRQIDIRRWGECMRRFRDPWELMEHPIHTLSYQGGEDGAKDMEEKFPELKFPMFAGKMGADVVEKQASKAEGLKRLCRHYQVKPEDTIAIGDSMNDYEILQTAGLGIAMGNAVEELKSVADYITADIGEDGIYKACRHFGWIPAGPFESE